MNKFQFIYFDNDITYYDKYFDYLNKIKGSLPEGIENFFCDKQVYELNGEKTLHDAWIESLDIRNTFSGNDISSSIEVIFLLASHQKKLKLVYEDILGLSYKNEPSFWSSKAVDLLNHELTVQDHELCHLMQFDRDVWLSIKFTKFSFTYCD